MSFLKKSLLVKNAVATFGQDMVKFGHLFISTSGHTAHMKGSKTGRHKRKKVYNEGNSTQKQKEKENPFSVQRLPAIRWGLWQWIFEKAFLKIMKIKSGKWKRKFWQFKFDALLLSSL